MTLPVMPFLPAPDPYSYMPGSGVVSSDVEFGPSRSRRDFIDPVSRVQVQWQLNKSQYSTFMLLYRTTLVSGSMPFTMMLVTESGDPTACTCKFVPDSLRLGTAVGHYRPVSAELEVISSSLTSEVFNEFTMLLDEFGLDWSHDFTQFEDELHTILNVSIPGYLS